MTKEDITRMAREAGFERTKMHNALEQFAYIVAAAEREACARLCFQMWNEWMDNEFISELNRPDAEDCAHAIRKREQAYKFADAMMKARGIKNEIT